MDRLFSIALTAGLLLGSSLVPAQDQAENKGQRLYQPHGQMMQGPHGARMIEMKHAMDAVPMMGKGMMHPMMGSPHPNMGEDIDLTEEQTTQLADLHATLAREHFVLMREMREPRERLHELMSAEQLDIEAIGQAYDTLAELRKAMLLNRLEAQQNMQEIIEDGS